jgi:hypothetical protein
MMFLPSPKHQKRALFSLGNTVKKTPTRLHPRDLFLALFRLFFAKSARERAPVAEYSLVADFRSLEV